MRRKTAIDNRDGLQKAVESEREACAKEMPTTWLDPLLSGPDAPNLPWGCPEIEAYTRALADRIRARTEGKG